MHTRKLPVIAQIVRTVTIVLGAGSLSLFGVFLWNGSFGFVDLGMSSRALLVWDAALCLLFILQHSGMVRKSFRARLSLVFPEYTHGVVYTISSAAALLLLVACWQPSATQFYSLQGLEKWLIRAVMLLALAGFVWGAASLKKFDAFGIAAYLLHVLRIESHPSPLTIAGPYRFVRHPFYAFAIIAYWATPALSPDRLLLNCLFTAWTILGAALEERDLTVEFGQQYELYKRSVPMLVPRLAPRPKRLAASR